MARNIRRIVVIGLAIFVLIYFPLKAVTNEQYRQGATFAANFQLKNSSDLTRDLTDNTLCSSLANGVITIDGSTGNPPNETHSADWLAGCIKTMHLIRLLPAAS